MRSTINLPDSLAEAVKQRAQSQGRTFTSMIEEGLRCLLAQSEKDEPVVTLPSYGDPNGRFSVDITDRAALWDALDADGVR